MADDFNRNPEEDDRPDEDGDTEVPLIPKRSADGAYTRDTTGNRYIPQDRKGNPFSSIWLGARSAKNRTVGWLAERSSGFWTALATVVIAYTTVQYTWIAKHQWGVMERQWGEMREATDVARRSADDAEYALRVSERAYLDISYPSVDFSDSAFGKPTTYRIRITNKGRTPATNVVCQMSATSAWPPKDAGQPSTWSELYPDAWVDCVIVSDFIFTKQIKRNYVTGIVKRHVHGFISYDTVFKDERGIPVSERRNYCFQYCPRLHGFTICGEPNTELQCYEKQNRPHGPN